MEQIGLFEQEHIADRLVAALIPVLDANHIDHKHLKKSNNVGSISLSVAGSLILRLHEIKTKDYITFPERYAKHLPENIKTKPAGTGFVRIDLFSIDQAEEYLPAIRLMADAAIDAIPKEFDCCNSFNYCSKAGKCLHKDKDFAMLCGYKRVLKYGYNWRSKI